jgi:hypothetical protein
VTLIQDCRSYSGETTNVRTSLLYRCGDTSSESYRQARLMYRFDSWDTLLSLEVCCGLKCFQISSLISRGSSANFPRLENAMLIVVSGR